MTTESPSTIGTPSDDRGAPVRPLFPAGLLRENVTPDDLKARQRLAKWLRKVLRAKPAISKASPLRFVPTVLGMVAVLSCINLSSLRAQFGNAAGFVPWCLLLVGIVIERRIIPSLGQNAGTASFVAEGFCGQCGYSLRDLPSHADGCTVCPECGAAWKAARITWPWWQRGDPPWVARTDRPFFPLERSRYKSANFDAFGRLVTFLTLNEIKRFCAVPEGENVDRIEIADAFVRKLGRRERWRNAIVTSIVLVAVTIFAGSIAEDWRVALFVVPVWVFGLWHALSVLGSEMYIDPKDRARLLVRHGICPACARLWTSTEFPAVGRGVCTGCGSTWIREREPKLIDPSPPPRAP